MTYQHTYPDLTSGEYTFTATKKNLDLDYIYNLLCVPSRYSTGLPAERFPCGMFLLMKNIGAKGWVRS